MLIPEKRTSTLGEEDMVRVEATDNRGRMGKTDSTGLSTGLGNLKKIWLES